MTLPSLIFDAALALSAKGIAVHWLRPKDKAPVDSGWPNAPVATPESLKASYQPGFNVGIRPGRYSRVGELYAHVVDVDVKDPSGAREANDWLDQHLPGWRQFPAVKSGSGGESRHVYLFLDRPLDYFLAAHSPNKIRHDGKSVWAWAIEFFGTNRNIVLPPSVHPKTGKPYEWVRRIDFDLLDLGVCPSIIPANRVLSWRGADSRGKTEPNVNRLTNYSIDDARHDLGALPEEWASERELWVKAGQACHHQFGTDGFELWDAFSRRCADKYDADDCLRVWKSFHSDGEHSVTMRTVKGAARAVEIAEMFDDVEDDCSADVITKTSLDDICNDICTTKDQLDAEDIETIEQIGGPQSAAALAKSIEPAIQWASKLDLNDEGAIKPTLHNVALIVRNDPRTIGLPRLNLFTLEMVQRTSPGAFKMRKPGPKGTKQLAGPIWDVKDTTNGDLWTEARDDAIRDILEAPRRQGGYGIRITDRDLRSALSIVARDNAFHPVREYLDALQWDEQPRMETVFSRFLGAPDNPYTRDVNRLMLVAAVARVYEPGHKFDFAVILEGFQGKRKSTFIEILGRHWFSELTADFHDPRQTIENMQGSWILEIPELKQFTNADIRTLKGFISRKTDKGRLAYARRATEFERQCIFIGSTNDREYLRDDTGGRRFWPIECKVDRIDTDGFALEVDQVWAETVARYRELRARQPRGTLPLYLSESGAANAAIEIQESRRVETSDDALVGQVIAWLDKPIVDECPFDDLDDLIGGASSPQRNETCLLQIWCECLGRDVASYLSTPAASQSLGRAMKKVNDWNNIGVRRTAKYGAQRVYRRFGFCPEYGDAA